MKAPFVSVEVIVNTSYRNKELTEEINSLVGKPYGAFNKARWRGIGSPRLKIQDASVDLTRYLRKIEVGEFCNIELRPAGIIIRFRYILDNMAWIIPYYQLSVFKSGETYSFHGGGDFLKLSGAYSDSSVDKFVTRLIEAKAIFSSDITPDSSQ